MNTKRPKNTRNEGARLDPAVVELVVPDAATRTREDGDLSWLPGCVTETGLDLDTVRRTDPVLAEALAGYALAAERFVATLRDGQETGGLAVIRRRLGTWRQGTKNSDLNAQYDALVRSPLGAAVTALCNPRPGDLGAHPQVELISDEETGAEAVLRFEGPVGGEGQDEALGGAARGCEIEREVRLVIRRAKWRDRQVRRLTLVEVHATELWPDPAPWRELLETARVYDETAR